MVQKSIKKNNAKSNRSFIMKDCTLISISSGISAQNLREFREGLRNVCAASIYHHFWGRLLHTQFDEPEYNNDFASWAYHGLHDKILAERLSVIAPTDFDDIEALRSRLVDICEERLDETELVPWAPADRMFHFIYSQIVLFDTQLKARVPEELPDLISKISRGSIFYHFIDSRRRTPRKWDDFSTWISSFGKKYDNLIAELQSIDPYFSSLEVIGKRIASILDFYLHDQRNST